MIKQKTSPTNCYEWALCLSLDAMYSLFLTYVIMYIRQKERIPDSYTKQSMGQILECFCKSIYLFMTFTQSHRPEEVIPDSYDTSCGPGLV